MLLAWAAASSNSLAVLRTNGLVTVAFSPFQSAFSALAAIPVRASSASSASSVTTESQSDTASDRPEKEKPYRSVKVNLAMVPFPRSPCLLVVALDLRHRHGRAVAVPHLRLDLLVLLGVGLRAVVEVVGDVRTGLQ